MRLAALALFAAGAAACAAPQPVKKAAATCPSQSAKPLANKLRAKAILRCLPATATAPERLIAVQLLAVSASDGGWEEAIGVYDVGADTAPLGGPFRLSDVRANTRFTISETDEFGAIANPTLSLAIARSSRTFEVMLGRVALDGDIETSVRMMAYKRARLDAVPFVLENSGPFTFVEQVWPGQPDRLLIFAARPQETVIDQPLAAPVIEVGATARAMIGGKIRRFSQSPDAGWRLAD